MSQPAAYARRLVNVDALAQRARRKIHERGFDEDSVRASVRLFFGAPGEARRTKERWRERWDAIARAEEALQDARSAFAHRSTDAKVRAAFARVMEALSELSKAVCVDLIDAIGPMQGGRGFFPNRDELVLFLTHECELKSTEIGALFAVGTDGEPWAPAYALRGEEGAEGAVLGAADAVRQILRRVRQRSGGAPRPLYRQLFDLYEIPTRTPTAEPANAEPRAKSRPRARRGSKP